MAITRIKNNQITDSTIDGGTKIADTTITAGKLENDLTYGSNLTVTGNLTVNGTTTTISTTNTTVEDPIMVLASTQVGAGSVDIGFIGERGTDTNVAFVWDESADQFVMGYVSEADSNTSVTFTAQAPLKVDSLITTGAGASTFTSLDITPGNLSVAGTTDLTGVLTAGDIDAGTLDTTGAVTIGTTLGVTGLTTLSGGVSTTTITASGTSNLNGGIAVDGTNFTVSGTTGDVSTAGTLSVTGTSTLAAIDASGLASLDGGIDVDGAFTVADTTGNVSTTGTLSAGATTVSSLTDSSLTNNRIVIAGTAGILEDDANLTFDGTLLNVGASFSVAQATGNTTIGGTLGVTGTSTLQNTTISHLEILETQVTAGSFVVSEVYEITSAGTTDFTLIGAADNNVGTIFTATGAGTGTGTAKLADTFDAGGNRLSNLSDPVLAQDAVTKAYVDAQSASGFVLSDTTNTSTISGGDTLTVNGTTNEVTVLVSGDSLTIGLPDDVTIGSTLTVTGALAANGGITVDSTAFTVADTSGNVATAGTLDVAGLASLDGGIDVDGAFTVANTTGNISTTGTLSSGAATLSSAQVSDLTNNRIVIAGLSGELEDDANLTFDGTTFEVGTLFDVVAASGNTAIGGTLTVTGLTDLNGGLTVGAITVDAASTLNFGANKLTNVADPTASQDAATKAYVDNLATTGIVITDGSTPQTLALGDTLTIQGTANEVNVAVSATDTLTIGLPDDVTITNTFTANGLASLDGGIDVDGVFTVANTTGNLVTSGTADFNGAVTMGSITFDAASTINAGNNKIINVTDPTAAQDAATKAYVDSVASTGFTLSDSEGVPNTTVISGSDTLTVSGVANETTVIVGVDTLTIGLPDDVTIGNDLTITGATNAAAINATGLASLDGGIDVDGAFTVADTTGDISTTGGLNVDGTTTLASTTWDAASTIDAGLNKIINVADPTAANDATNKSYVDNLVASGTVWRDPVKDPDLAGVVAAEPGAPQTGAGYIYYIDGVTGSQVWTGAVTVNEGDYVYWSGTAWIYVHSIVAGDRFLIGAEHATIESSLYNLGFREHDLVQYVSGEMDVLASWTFPSDAGYSVIDFTDIKTGASSTGFANDATVYVLDVSTDVGSGETLSQVQVTGSAAQTFATLITEINTDLDATFGAGNVVATLMSPDGHIHIENTATAARVTISEGTAAGTGMLATLTNFEAVKAGIEDGTTVIANDVDSNHYGHTYMYSHEGNNWTEISGPGSIAAGDNLAYSGNTLNVVGGAASGLDADLLDGQQGAYYLDWTNTTNKPDPTITLGGDASGSITLTDLAGGTLTVTVLDDSHNHIIANVDGLQTALDSKLNDTGDTMNGNYTVGATFTISQNTAPTLGDHLTNKTYVDGLLAAGFTLSAGGNTSTISGGDTLTVNGTANEIEISQVAASDTITIGLPDNVTVTGLLSVNGGINADTGAFTVADTTGNVATNGTLTVAGLSNLNGGIAVDGTNFTVNGTTGAVATASTLDVAGLASLDGGIDVDGAFTVADVTGNISTSGTLSVTGTSTLGVINASGLASLDGGIDVDGAFTVADVTGNVSTSGTLNVTGTSTLGVINASGLASLDGGIDVDGAFTVADTTGNINTTGTLGVDGNVTFNADLTMTGGVGDAFVIQDGAAATKFSVESTTGNTSISGTLNTLGLASLDGGIDVDGAFIVADTTGNVSTTGTLTVTGATDLNGALTLTTTTWDAASTINGGANRIQNIADPTAAQDAATKAYVDSVASTGFTLSAGGNTSVISGSDTLTINGTANEVDIAMTAGSDTMTIGLPSDVTIGNNLTVTAAASVGTTLGVTGITTLGGLLNANGGIAVDTNAFTVQDTTGNTSVGGTLGVTGAATMSSTLGVTGAATFQNDITLVGGVGDIFIINDGTTTKFSVDSATGNTLVEGTLDVNGQADLVNTNIVGTLDVAGQADIDNITINGNDITANAGTEVVINEAGADVDFRVETTTQPNMFQVDAGTNTINMFNATPVTGAVLNVGSDKAAIMPKGGTADRPAVGVAGMMRFNTTNSQYEFFDGTVWKNFGTEFTVIASESFAGDDVTTVFALSSSQTTASCIVSINGVIQLPTTAYSVSGTNLTFTEAPATGDAIEVREITTTFSINAVSDGISTMTANNGNFDIVGHMIPATDITYDLGSLSNQWRDLYLSGTTIHLGGLQIKNDAGTVKFFESDGVTPAPIEAPIDPDTTVDGGTY